MLKKTVILTTALFACVSMAHAQTTMCFKQNHKDLMTIENTNLDGGECNGSQSANEMKKQGWVIDDIKMTPSNDGTNFVYIFKKNTNMNNIDQAALEEQIMQRMQAKEDAKIEQQKEELFAQNSKAGEQLYVNKCAVCHGDKGELKARGVSRPINTLDHNDFKASIRDYTIGNKDGSLAILMKPYADMMDYNDIRNVYTYLKSINQEK
jgi:cytochrome c553